MRATRRPAVIRRLFPFDAARLRWRPRSTPEQGWRRYLATGDARGALPPGRHSVGGLELAVDRALSAGPFFLIEGWLVGPGAREAGFEVASRRGLCGSVAFRRERFDVNDAFGLARFFPDQHLGFRVFGRLPAAAEVGEPLLGFATRLQDAERRLPLAPVAAAPEELAGPLLQAIRQDLPASGADLENAALLLTQLHAFGSDGTAPPAFPPAAGEAVDALVLARHRPEIAGMNATLVRRVLPAASRVFLVAGDWNAARALQGLGFDLHPPVTTGRLDSAPVIESFLLSQPAPATLLVLDDVFIASCLSALAAALAEGRSLAVPRVRQLAPAPALVGLEGAPQADILGRPFLPLGVLLVQAADAIAPVAPQRYAGRGFLLEDLFVANRERFHVAATPCLDLLSEEQAGDAQYLNREASLLQAAGA